MASTSDPTEAPSSTMALTSNATEIPSSMRIPSMASITQLPSSMRIPSPPPEYEEEKIRKRRIIDKTQGKSLIHGFQLQLYLGEIIESKDTLQETLKNLVESRKPSIVNVIASLVYHYPNALAYKLVELLEFLPPLPIRREIILILLRIFNESDSLNSIIVVEFKNPLLNSLNIESNLTLLPGLCEIIGLLASCLYRCPLGGGWIEVLHYICGCFSVKSKLALVKGLIMLAELPVQVVRHRDYWLYSGNFDLLCNGVWTVFHSEDKELQDICFKSSLMLMKLSIYLERTEICNTFLPNLLCLINSQHGKKEEKDLLEMVKGLLDLARLRSEKMFISKVTDLFWSMFGVAERVNASNELMVVAVAVIKELNEAYRDEMKTVIQRLSQEKEEVKRAIAIAMSIMSCVVEDPEWYDIDSNDCEDAGSTQNYKCGHYFLSLLSSHGDESVFVPIVMEMLEKKYAVHTDWNVRYAAMLSIAAIVEKHFQGDMIIHIDKAVVLVHKSLNDKTPQVLWASMRAIICLSEYKEILKFCKYHMKFLDKIIPVIKNSNCPRVQAYAIIATRFLVRNCGLEQIVSYGEEVLVLLLILVKNKSLKLKEEALEALKIIADLIPEGTFRQKYYDATMEALTTVLFDNAIASNLFLRDKCLEFMITLAMNFRQVDVLVKSLTLIEEKLSDTDYTARLDILKALDQFCKSLEVNSDQFIDEIMPMILKCAQASMPIDLSLDDNLVEKLRVLVCSILSSCAVRSAEKITLNIDKVIAIFLKWIEYSSIEIRKACISAIPNLLHSIKISVPERDNMIDAAHHIVTSMINAIKKETDTEIHRKFFRVLPKCIQISGRYFRSELIVDITDVMSQILKNILQNEITREATGTFEVGSDFLPTEETIKDAGFLIAKTIEAFRIRRIQLLAHIDQLMQSVSLFLSSNMPDRVVALVLSIFNILVSESPKTFLSYHDSYIETACAAIDKEYPHSRLHATRAIGICAKFGKQRFNECLAMESVQRLDSVISGGADDLHDTAVSAFGKICFYRPNVIKDWVAIKWVSLLPLKHNLEEAKYAHAIFARLIKRRDPELVGPRNANVPTIMSVVKKILDGPGQLIELDDRCELESFADYVRRMK